MVAKHIKKSRKEAGSSWFHSTRLHVVLYSFLLVATPFILLQNYLQDAIGRLSASTLTLAGLEIPIVPTAAIILLVPLLIYFYSYLTRLRIAAAFIALFMIVLAQQITDYYFNHRFYELQQNWHYIAYAIFAFMMYRDLAPRAMPLAKIMLITYFSAMLFSSFDEGFQKFMANRIFDVSDIAKDVWGTLAGMVLIYLGGKLSNALLEDRKRLRHPRLRDYARHPFSLLILLFVLSLLLLIVSSLLTDFSYLFQVVLITFSGFLVFFLIFHFSQYKWGKYGLITVLTVGLLLQAGFFLRHRSDHVVHNQYGLTVYKGLPIIFFDVMIFPDGTFRLVDKKHTFNNRDRTFLLKQEAEIILIGSGAQGKGGNGFSEKAISQFIYNHNIHRGTQVIILKNSEACKLFNRLKREQKNVLFILHNTC